MTRYEVKPAEPRYGETEPSMYLILDTATDELVRVQSPGQRPGRLRLFRKRADAERTVRRLNGEP